MMRTPASVAVLSATAGAVLSETAAKTNPVMDTTNPSNPNLNCYYEGAGFNTTGMFPATDRSLGVALYFTANQGNSTDPAGQDLKFQGRCGVGYSTGTFFSNYMNWKNTQPQPADLEPASQDHTHDFHKVSHGDNACIFTGNATVVGTNPDSNKKMAMPWLSNNFNITGATVSEICAKQTVHHAEKGALYWCPLPKEFKCFLDKDTPGTTSTTTTTTTTTTATTTSAPCSSPDEPSDPTTSSEDDDTTTTSATGTTGTTTRTPATIPSSASVVTMVAAGAALFA